MGLQRYSQFSITLTDANGNAVPSGLAFADFLYSGRIVYHSVLQSERGRLDLIAYKYLKDNSLWPYIGWFNNIRDPIKDVCLGKELAIPVDVISPNMLIPFAYQQVA